MLKNTFLVLTALLSLGGCYKVAENTKVAIVGNFEQSTLDPKEKVKKFCIDIEYKTEHPNAEPGERIKFNKQTLCGLETTSEVRSGQVVTNFVFKLKERAEVYEIKSLSNIYLTTTSDSSDCKDCAIQVTTKVYEGSLTSLASAEKPLTVYVDFKLIGTQSQEKWVSSYESIVKGCTVVAPQEKAYNYCIQYKIKADIASACMSAYYSVYHQSESTLINCLAYGAGQ